MLELEQQVCSLELAKKLKEIGVKQESLFHWHYINEHCYSVRYITAMTICTGEYLYSSFTVAELGEMLPAYININGDICLLELSKYIIPTGKEKGKIQYASEYFVQEDNHYKLATGFYEEKEADARAKMLIYLIENNLVKVKDNE